MLLMLHWTHPSRGFGSGCCKGMTLCKCLNPCWTGGAAAASCCSSRKVAIHAASFNDHQGQTPCGHSLQDRRGGGGKLLVTLRVNNDLFCDMAALVALDDTALRNQGPGSAVFTGLAAAIAAAADGAAAVVTPGRRRRRRRRRQRALQQVQAAGADGAAGGNGPGGQDAADGGFRQRGAIRQRRGADGEQAGAAAGAAEAAAASDLQAAASSFQQQQQSAADADVPLLSAKAAGAAAAQRARPQGLKDAADVVPAEPAASRLELEFLRFRWATPTAPRFFPGGSVQHDAVL